MQFPELFQQWQTHDLARYRPIFYEGLHPEDERVVWEFIEQNYLLRYKELVLFAFEWSANGLWGIRFPGSVDMGRCLSPEYFQIPTDLSARIAAWHNERDCGSKPWDDNDPFDYVSSDRRALELAKEVKLFLGDSYYVEFNPFQEIKIIGTQAIETEIPEFIRSICNKK